MVWVSKWWCWASLEVIVYILLGGYMASYWLHNIAEVFVQV